MKSALEPCSRSVSALAFLATFAVLGASGHARAQEDDGDEEEKPATATPAPARAPTPAATPTPAPATVTAATPADTTTQRDDQSERRNGYVAPPTESALEWHGGLDADTGYASYTFDQGAARPQAFYDMRGRFVVGPTLEYRFKNSGVPTRWFVAARGELVAWLRETNAYQINADDVYAEVGLKGVWDLKIGRFFTWRVYHKGAGFDLYTLEDVGACRVSIAVTGSCSLETGADAFGPHTYEVNNIYYREPAGRVALHLYPSPWSGIELTGALGNNGVNNTLGGRAAALLHFDFLRVSAGAEYRSNRPAQAKSSMDPVSGAAVDCPNCGVSHSYGFGGGFEVTIKPIELGLNAAQSRDTFYTATNGTLDNDASGKRTSLGGYAELDLGSFTFERSLILGFGLNRTEVVDQVDNFEQHYQEAAYVLFPLGFNAASLKLVFSQATLDIQSANGDGTATELPRSTTRAARLRFSYPF
jgi:hypothetical protein